MLDNNTDVWELMYCMCCIHDREFYIWCFLEVATLCGKSCLTVLWFSGRCGCCTTNANSVSDVA